MKTLQTKRINLRGFTYSDVNDFYEISSDPYVTEFLTWGPHNDVSDAENSLKNLFMGNENYFCIEDRALKKCIGVIDVRLTPEHKKASFGYMLNRNFWGKGIMTEVLSEIFRYLFTEFDIQKIESSHYKGNPASGKVMIKCGMVNEGTQVDSLIIKGRTVSVENYGITKKSYLIN